ncbi:gamma-glutamyl-gamma-aminobutyrate hydrolase family protein [Oceanobacillus locisalsi]|uniref:Gamma-glutamyl-gamma-aminobutyrate hydrolase family protein n=1 Tax=Oceanobacillus locisalsi TaxID=546107 RepID=A0ABW3NGW6_9BACI
MQVKPIIGMTASMEVDGLEYKMNVRNVKAVEQAGGIPVILPYYNDYQEIDSLLHKMDGLYLPGGYDIDPSLFGEEPHPDLGIIIPERDRLEKEIIPHFLEADKPILAVCRGCQILNVVTGGTMYQDLHSQYPSQLMQHTQKAAFHHRSHPVKVTPISLLEKIVQTSEIRVNSYHHQANRSLGKNFIVSAEAADGVIEAFESKIHRFVLGVQWHPEGLIHLSNDPSQTIYQRFVEACKVK